MTFEHLEAAVLALPRETQAELIAKLLENFGNVDDIDRAVADTWVETAKQRDQEMEQDEAIGIPASEVFQRIRASRQ